MNKIAGLIFGCILSGQVVAADYDGLMHFPAMFRASVEQIELSASEKMGLVGTGYLVDIAPNLYLGGAVYGAYSGERGGFFTIGPELAWQQRLYRNVEWSTGLYAGAGGGGGATELVGGGLMLRPHVDLMWNFGVHRVGVSASKVYFPSGKINSNQIGLVYSANTEFLQLDPFYFGEPKMYEQRTGIGFDRIQAVAGKYQGEIFGKPGLSRSIGLIGFRMEQHWTETSAWGIEAAGAASGGAAGYAEFLGTVSTEAPVLDRHAAIGVRAGIGVGGGGAVSVGGGKLFKLGGYVTANLSRDFHASIEAGHVSAPNGQLSARYATANLTMDLDHLDEMPGYRQIDKYSMLLGAARYTGIPQVNGSKSQIEVITLKVNRHFNEFLYLSGQAHSAFHGTAGGYSAGFIGAGLKTSDLPSGISLGAEVLLGAAGGGAIASGSGATYAPNAFLEWRLDNLLSMRLAAGRIKSARGSFESQTVGLSLKYSYSTSSR